MNGPVTVGVVSPKGGVGKTTISVHLAHAAELDGDSAVVIDTDRQGSALDWFRKREGEGRGPPRVLHEDDPGALPGRVREVGVGRDVVVLDGPAQLQKMTGRILQVSDVCLVPLKPSGLDIWGTEEFRGLLERRLEDGLTAALVASQRDPRTTLPEELEEITEGYPFPLLYGTCKRVAYVRAMSKGQTVLEGSDAKAKNEVRQLLIDIANLLRT